MDDQRKQKLKEYNKEYCEKNKERFQQYRNAYYAKKKQDQKLNDTYIHQHISAYNLP